MCRRHLSFACLARLLCCCRLAHVNTEQHRVCNANGLPHGESHGNAVALADSDVESDGDALGIWESECVADPEWFCNAERLGLAERHGDPVAVAERKRQSDRHP